MVALRVNGFEVKLWSICDARCISAVGYSRRFRSPPTSSGYGSTPDVIRAKGDIAGVSRWRRRKTQFMLNAWGCFSKIQFRPLYAFNAARSGSTIPVLRRWLINGAMGQRALFRADAFSNLSAVCPPPVAGTFSRCRYLGRGQPVCQFVAAA